MATPKLSTQEYGEQLRRQQEARNAKLKARKEGKKATRGGTSRESTRSQPAVPQSSSALPATFRTGDIATIAATLESLERRFGAMSTIPEQQQQALEEFLTPSEIAAAWMRYSSFEQECMQQMVAGTPRSCKVTYNLDSAVSTFDSNITYNAEEQLWKLENKGCATFHPDQIMIDRISVDFGNFKFDLPHTAKVISEFADIGTDDLYPHCGSTTACEHSSELIRRPQPDA
jgi:hypothetical protein